MIILSILAGISYHLKNGGIIMNKLVVSSCVLALGLVLAGFLVGRGIESFSEKGRVVEVRGLSEKEVPADRVTWNLNFTEVGDNLLEVHKQISAKNEIIYKYLVDNGIPKEDIFQNAPNVYDKSSNIYAENKGPRYSVTSGMTVSSAMVDKVRELVSKQGGLLEKGVALEGSAYNVDYQFTGLNGIKPQMIEEATKAAREAAEKFAKDSDSKLGKIRNASQGQFSIESLNSTTPYIKKVRIVTYVSYSLND